MMFGLSVAFIQKLLWELFSQTDLAHINRFYSHLERRGIGFESKITVLPILVLSVWSRAWVGWWSLLSVAIAVAWVWLNPRIFRKPRSTDNWASRGVLGERVWLNRKNLPVPKYHRTMPSILSGVSGLGLPFIIWGLWRLEMWPTLVGCILVYAGKLWFLDRMVWIYEDMKDKDPEYGSWLYKSNEEQQS